ncbi:IMP cyclohydrolase [Haladaptatus salinisoli]|uniref:IMP cyclohydrolase n=1 Tax=Haladaptatus salinisoli TaxID=2884876 RepID=UPI001D0A3823|nr:IMP cyclohydrolase [Haladaptatus salinisoli]
MYVGRFIVIGPDIGAYRVSSRSFPNREAVARGDTVTIAPTEDAPETDNPYIAYNCVRVAGDTAVVGNGSHVDPVAEKLELGYPARDALAETLLALDYEKDDYDTPRIAGTVGEESYVGVVRRDALLVEEVAEPTLVATYEKDAPEPFDLESFDFAASEDEPTTADGAKRAEEAADAVYDLDFEHPVCSVGVARTAEDGGAELELAVENGN